MSNFDNIVQRIAARYNPDNDLVPGAPDVTWADYALMQLVEELCERVVSLEKDNDILLCSYAKLVVDLKGLTERIATLESLLDLIDELQPKGDSDDQTE